MIATPIDALLTCLLGPAYEPVKICVKSYLKDLSKTCLKKKLTGKVTKFIRNTQCKITKISKKISFYIRDVCGLKKKPRAEQKIRNMIWKKTKTSEIKSKIYTSIYNQSVARIVDFAIDNLDIISSAGGFFAGCMDYYYDNKVNNVLWRIR